MDLKELRKKIDALDAQLVNLLNQRSEVSKHIGKFKLARKQSIYAPDREQKVFDGLAMLNQGPLPDEALVGIYREIMSSSLALEKPLQIAMLGQEGSYTSAAAKKKFGSQISYIPCMNIAEVFHKVEHGDCDYGVVAIENSTEGSVRNTYDLFVDSELKICSQVMVKIAHHFMSKTSLRNIKRIYSHPQVFGQCRQWLWSHLPEAKQIWVQSTSEGAEIAAREKNAAAIASKETARTTKLKILHSNIQDIPHNTTKFFVIAPEDAAPSGNDRTSILFSIKDRVGALYGMLTPFYKHKINLTKIESRPSKKRVWDYYFFVDFEGHRLDKNVQKALSQLDEMCKYLKILGSYPVVK
ncbi:MAG: prephenate dehydratase [Candidatus Omnitrophica bacterium]|nr:prephenate dehydratase [Candidatus Omnitrophota bacterium]